MTERMSAEWWHREADRQLHIQAHQRIVELEAAAARRHIRRMYAALFKDLAVAFTLIACTVVILTSL